MTTVVNKYVWHNATEMPILNTTTPMPMKMVMNSQPNAGTTENSMEFLADLRHSLENITSRFWNYSISVDINPTGTNLSIQQESLQTSVGLTAVICLLVTGKRLLTILLFYHVVSFLFLLVQQTHDLATYDVRYYTEGSSDAGVYFLTHELVSVRVTPY